MPTAQNQNSNVQVQSSEMQAAEEVARSFNSAFKYFSLYPEGHSFSEQYLSRFKKELSFFLTNYKAIRLDTTKSNYLYKGEQILQGKAEDSNPAYLLSRDRILYIEFTKNITDHEISLFLNILKKHRNPLDNEDSDIATTLWHHKFDHINYEAADIFAMEAIQFELSMFKAAPGAGAGGDGGDAVESGGSGGSGSGHQEGYPGGEGQAQMGEGGQHGEVEYDDTSPHDNSVRNEGMAPSSLSLISGNSSLIEIDAEEQKQLAVMVHEAEDEDYASDVIDILLITLSVEPNEIDFAAILEFLEHEFFDAMAREDFSVALKITSNVRNISEHLKKQRPWAMTLINMFFTALGREDRLTELAWFEEYERIASISQKNQPLLNIFKQLAGDTTLILGRLATQLPAEKAQLGQEIGKIIAAKAGQNPESLCKLIEESDEDGVKQLLSIVEKLDRKNAAKAYLQMTKHKATSIRTEGIHGYFNSIGQPDIEDVVQIMLEPEDFLKKTILEHLASLNDKLLEKILITFLGEAGAGVESEKYILHCYKLLGTCVSPDSTEFLGNVLLGSEVKSLFSHKHKAHKQGSAYVLYKMNTPQTRKVLRKGAESMRPDVRQICKKYLEN